MMACDCGQIYSTLNTYWMDGVQACGTVVNMDYIFDSSCKKGGIGRTTSIVSLATRPTHRHAYRHSGSEAS